ncbi:MAG: TIGR00266 family protein [Anaeroplasmataceae bacterium]
MKYEIKGKSLPLLVIELEKGEEIFAQSGSMTYVQPQISFKPKMKGGLFKGLGRALTGESMFQTVFTAEESGEVALSMSMVGAIIPYDLSKGPFICQKSSFLAAQMNIEQKMVFQKKLSAGFFGGEGFVLQQLSGNGIAFLEATGEVIERELQSGETLIVDNGHIVGFEPSVKYDVRLTKGIKNMLFSGEGATNVHLTGPGKILIQSITAQSLANIVAPFIVTKGNS